MRRHVIVVVLLVVLLTVGAASAGPIPSYSINVIPVPAGLAYFIPNAINDAGRVLGDGAQGSGPRVGVLLDGSPYTVIAGPNAIATFAMALNDSGTVGGSYAIHDPKGYPDYAFSFSGGTLTGIAYPGAARTQIWGINDAGVLSGRYCMQVDQGGGSCVDSTGFTYDGATFTPYRYLGAFPTNITGVNDAGQVVGYAFMSGPTQVGFLYDGAIYTPISFPGASQTTPYDINDSGLVVGEYWDAIGSHGFLYKAGVYQQFDVPGTIFNPSVQTMSLTGVNDAGHIVGFYTTDLYSPGGLHGFEAAPVPEPTTWLLVASGALGLMLLRSRAR
jgi:hypothetical protein